MFTETTITRTLLRTNLGVFVKEDFCGFAKTKTHNIIGFPRFHGEIVTIAVCGTEENAEEFLDSLMTQPEEA